MTFWLDKVGLEVCSAGLSRLAYVMALPDRLREVEEVCTPRLGEPELIESLWHRTAEPLPHRFQHLVLVDQALVLRLENQDRRVAVGLASAELFSSCA